MTHREVLEALSGLLLAMFVAMLSSTVVTNALPRIVTEVNRNSQKLAVSGMSQHIQKIFRMVGLAQYAEIYQDEDEAIQGIAAAAR